MPDIILPGPAGRIEVRYQRQKNPGAFVREALPDGKDVLADNAFVLLGRPFHLDMPHAANRDPRAAAEQA